MHPKHTQLAQAVRGWFHQPYEGMGYRAERRCWGTWWDHGYVYVHGLALDQVTAFLDDMRTYYQRAHDLDRTVQVIVDDRRLDAGLGPALQDAGCTPGKTDLFLAHTGPVPPSPVVPGLHIEQVDESNLHALAIAKLRAFSDHDALPGEAQVSAEVAQRHAELSGSAHGMLARIDGEPVGGMWWYGEVEATWIVLLGVRALFRRRGIARLLLHLCLTQAQGESKPVLINVLTDNSYALHLYRRLGFTDVVYWRRRYVLPGGSRLR